MPGRSLVVIGAGGNIGSHLVPHLGRMPSVGHVTLIDRDVYERSNLLAQDFLPRDVGRAKAEVQARRLRGTNPDLAVTAIPRAVEDVPQGRLRADVMLACLDSRRARQRVNEVAWHLGVPWIDAGVGVLGDGGLLARVTTYVPGPGQPCLECAWDERDYAQIEQSYACGARSAASRPTGAPSSLGALAASLQALECRRLLAGETGLGGRQVLLDAAAASLVSTRFRRRPSCRMSDHEVWDLVKLPRTALDLPLAAALALGRDGDRATAASTEDASGPQGRARATSAPDLAGATLEVAGRCFERRLICPACGGARACLRLAGARRAPPRCARCAGTMVPSSFDLAERLRGADLSPAERARTLRSLGVRSGDLLRIEGGGGDRCFEITGDHS